MVVEGVISAETAGLPDSRISSLTSRRSSTTTTTSSSSSFVSSSSRESIVLDYGWKFRTGLTEWANPDEEPPTNTDPGLYPPESQIDYNNDKDWWNVQLPHDGLIMNGPSQQACKGGCSGRSFIPRHVLWYRNTFSIPTEWISSSSTTTHNGDNDDDEEEEVDNVIFLEFEGSFRNTTVWLNGEWVLNHLCGYTPFRIQLPINNNTNNTNKNNEYTVAVFVDPDNGDEGTSSSGSGWWYEGGGLYRHVRLIKTRHIHVEFNTLFVKSIPFQLPSSPSLLQQDRNNTGATSATLEMEASVTGLTTNDDTAVCYQFEIFHPNGSIVHQTSLTSLNRHIDDEKKKKEEKEEDDSSSFTIMESVEIVNPSLWTSAQPNLYQIHLILKRCGGHDRTSNHNNNNDMEGDDEELDRISVQHGIRKIHFDANTGFYLNDQRYKIRGFCDHDTFAVVGMALPDRINLFRVSLFLCTVSCRSGR